MYVLIGCIGLFLYLVGMFVYRLVEDPIWDLGEYSMLVGLGVVCAVAWPVVVTVVTVWLMVLHWGWYGYGARYLRSHIRGLEHCALPCYNLGSK